MRRSLVLALCLLWAGAAAAGPRVSLRVTMVGIPEGHVPQVIDVVAGQLAADGEESIRVVAAEGEWFWQEKPAAYAAEVVVEHYYGGRDRRTLIPMLAARYAYRMDAEGYVAITSHDGDTVRVVLPFEFSWQRPVRYQMTGIQPEAASMQVTAPESVKLESAAMEALGRDVARTIRHGLRRAKEADEAP